MLKSYPLAMPVSIETNGGDLSGTRQRVSKQVVVVVPEAVEHDPGHEETDGKGTKEGRHAHGSRSGRRLPRGRRVFHSVAAASADGCSLVLAWQCQHSTHQVPRQ